MRHCPFPSDEIISAGDSYPGLRAILLHYHNTVQQRTLVLQTADRSEANTLTDQLNNDMNEDDDEIVEVEIEPHSARTVTTNVPRETLANTLLDPVLRHETRQLDLARQRHNLH